VGGSERSNIVATWKQGNTRRMSSCGLSPLPNLSPENTVESNVANRNGRRAMTLATCTQCGNHVIAGDVCSHCGTPTPAPAPDVARYGSEAEVILEKLRRVAAPKYQVRRILGSGGMAGVYLADEPRLGRQVAIKVMSPSLMMDPKLVDRFGQEARTIAQLAHPNIITIYEVDDREDLHYFTMTYVAGRTLGQVLSESLVPLPIDVTRAWFYQIGDALAYAHKHGVVHRDVKPGNVLLDLRGNALVTDFGIAKVADSDSGLTRTGMLVGTPAYMSPEQCLSGRVTGASDQYSLGAVIYQMLTGQRPFEGPTLSVMQAHVTQQPRPIPELRPDCPQDLVAAVERMLQKRPEDRWPTLSAAIAAAGAAPPALDGPVRDQLDGLAVQAATISVDSWRETVHEGAREQLRVEVLDANGRQLGDRRVDWSADDAVVACVVPGGTLLATAPGRTVLHAMCGDAIATMSITVEADPVRDLQVKPARASLAVNGGLPLEAIVRDLDGTRLEDRAVLWGSAEPSVATVGSDGVVLGISPGEALITASTGGKMATAALTVTTAVADMPAFAGLGTLTRAAYDAATRPPTPARVGRTPAPAPTSGSSAGEQTSEKRAPRSSRRLLVAAGIIIVAGATPQIVRSAVSRRGGAGSSTDTLVTPPISRPPAVGSPIAEQRPVENRQPIQQAPAVNTDSARSTQNAPARGNRGSTRPQSTATRGTPAVGSKPTTNATAQPPAAPSPALGTLDVVGNVPNGATLVVRQPDGQTRVVTGRSVSLPAGDYVLEFNAPGYDADRQNVRVAAGESRAWTPIVREVARPRPAAVPPAPVHDKAADVEAIAGLVRDFAAAFDKRDTRAVVPLLPSDKQSNWQDLFENRSVKEFHARLDKIDPATIDGDVAQIDFTLHVTFRDANQKADVGLRFTGKATREGSGWRLVSLRSNG
jgi:tRNA A-37 threonylcarbamoyl transferase component Bud32/ketosteroid isomerase-like protein